MSAGCSVLILTRDEERNLPERPASVKWSDDNRRGRGRGPAPAHRGRPGDRQQRVRHRAGAGQCPGIHRLPDAGRIGCCPGWTHRRALIRLKSGSLPPILILAGFSPQGAAMPEGEMSAARARIETVDRRVTALQDLGIDTAGLRSQLPLARTRLDEGGQGSRIAPGRQLMSSSSRRGTA